jgi:hypothetical protein
MLKRSASGILASIRGLNVRPKVRFATLLAAALLGEGRVLARRGGRVRKMALLNILRAFLLNSVLLVSCRSRRR